MGYKNRTLEYENKKDNLKGLELLVKFSNEFNNLIINNKLRNKYHIELLISQMNGKFLSSLKSNNLIDNNTSIIFLPCPNIPVDTEVDIRVLRKILLIAQKKKIIVALDEVYFMFSKFDGIEYFKQFKNKL